LGDGQKGHATYKIVPLIPNKQRKKWGRNGLGLS